MHNVVLLAQLGREGHEDIVDVDVHVVRSPCWRRRESVGEIKRVDLDIRMRLGDVNGPNCGLSAEICNGLERACAIGYDAWM